VPSAAITIDGDMSDWDGAAAIEMPAEVAEAAETPFGVVERLWIAHDGRYLFFRIRFARTMSMLLGSGVGIIESLESTAGIFTNVVFTGSLSEATDRVRKGERLASSLSRSGHAGGRPLFSPALIGMIHAGEVGDRVPDVLESIGAGIELDLSQKIGVLTSLAEPVLILVLGSIVGFAVLSIMLPIFQFNQLFL
jgi:type II secretory pathway component PulF